MKDVIDNLEFIRQCLCKSPLVIECVICKAGNRGIGLDFCLLGQMLRRLRKHEAEVEREHNEIVGRLIDERDAAYVRGLARAKEVCARTCRDRDEIQAEIDKAKAAGK